MKKYAWEAISKVSEEMQQEELDAGQFGGGGHGCGACLWPRSCPCYESIISTKGEAK